jgi:AcrR family transcriptional regulator
MGRRPEIDGRELLLDAALRLFAEQGPEGVSIRAVNREAGLGPASVHYHFGTKEALLDAALHRYGDMVS